MKPTMVEVGFLEKEKNSRGNRISQKEA